MHRVGNRRIRKSDSLITLPALQKMFVIFFLKLPGDLKLKMAGVLVNFCGLHFPRNSAVLPFLVFFWGGKARKTTKKTRIFYP